ncbi:subunit of TIM23 translocase complex [Irineochytrium annulatum]|nr:subunit of TIM23 translocase complex [Irineochytrium annulatum]
MDVRPYLEKMKMGLIMGGATGMSVGFLVGSYTVLRYGPGERGFLGTIGTQMLQTGGFLGFIFSVGMLLRADDEQYRPGARPHWAVGSSRMPFVVKRNVPPVITYRD